MKRATMTPAESREVHVFGPPEEALVGVDGGQWCDARVECDEPVVFHRDCARYGLPMREDWWCLVCGATSAEEATV